MSNLDKLTADRVDQASDTNMPLCAKYMQKMLKADHKLKHWARQQYGLFLKGAGLAMEEALVFWESHFSKVMNHDEFQKKYAYSIRHNYGKEGARKDYTPPSCNKIILGTPPETGAYHGCPYRHLPDKQLAMLLQNTAKLSLHETQDIVTTAKSGHFQIACLKHFEITHPGHQNMDLGSGSSGFMEHPNQWFKASVQYHKIKSGSIPTVASVTNNGSSSAVSTAVGTSGMGVTVDSFNKPSTSSVTSSAAAVAGKRPLNEMEHSPSEGAAGAMVVEETDVAVTE